MTFITRASLNDAHRELKKLYDDQQKGREEFASHARTRLNTGDHGIIPCISAEVSLIKPRIDILEAALKENNPQIIDDLEIDDRTVSVGSKVTIEIEGRTSTWTILGPVEEDIASNIIGPDQTLAKLLIDEEVGSSVLNSQEKWVKIISTRRSPRLGPPNTEELSAATV
jgi:transcription elongation GreA/GreB family factor